MNTDYMTQKNRRWSIIWQLLVLVVFPCMIILGLLMRMNQAEMVNMGSFYAMMTLHGLGMAGILFSGAYAALWYLLSKNMTLNLTINKVVLLMIVLGFAGLIVSTLVGNFAAGWYLLYPLPFIPMGAWADWATGLSIVSMMVLGVAWLVGLLALLFGMSKKYGFKNLLGWQYLRNPDPEVKIKPIILITTVCILCGIVSLVAAALLMIMYLFKFFEPSLSFDALLQKNIAFLFGHTLTNITLYLGVAWVYELMPTFTGRKWLTDKVVVYSWNATMLLILFAFYHHMYMDFEQPGILQKLGQIASYLSAIPATVVTAVGFIAQIHKSGLSKKWKITPMLFFLGVVGWMIGGVAAVLDSTIVMNLVFHNTLWVPAHFHTYFLMGYVPFLLGFIYYFFNNDSNPDQDKSAKVAISAIVIGSYGFFATFYLGGINSIPRRFSNYVGFSFSDVHEVGRYLAELSTPFIVLLLIGLFLLYVSLLKPLFQSRKQRNTLG
ncbi:MAG: cbb3-type cytochrome c oxidase subunit I [Balneolaceae bacterium]